MPKYDHYQFFVYDTHITKKKTNYFKNNPDRRQRIISYFFKFATNLLEFEAFQKPPLKNQSNQNSLLWTDVTRFTN